MLRLPPFGAGQRIGLFGGSFNPAHRGHFMVAHFALKRLQLDWVWWLVSPQNPLKDPRVTDDYDKRLAYTQRVANHPRFVVTDVERQLHIKYTAETLQHLRGVFRHADFVWLMGADSLANLHRWHEWTSIAETLPIAVLARPGFTLRAVGSPAALRYEAEQVPPEQAAKVVGAKAPAWVFVSMPLRKESSTAIRARRKPKSVAKVASRRSAV
jgi:nicotinate-nucleotide adenylyltransferase